MAIQLTTSGTLSAKEKRAFLDREPRIPIVYPIRVQGFDVNGYYFNEATATIDVSHNGCHFKLRTQVALRAPLVFSLAETFNQSATFFRAFHEVVWVHPVEDGWEIGARRVRGPSMLRLVHDNQRCGITDRF